MIPTLLISGVSGTGKTTLIEKVIKELTDTGLKIAVLKHSKSIIDGEPASKDTGIFAKAGAVSTAVSGENLTLIAHHKVSTHSHKMTGHKSKKLNVHNLESPLSLAEKLFSNIGTKENDLQTPDLIIAEGYKSSKAPKIALIKTDEDLNKFENVIAWITELKDNSPSEELATSCNYGRTPHLYRNDISSIKDFIHQWWQKENSKEKEYCKIFLSDRNKPEIPNESEQAIPNENEQAIPNESELTINEYTGKILNSMVRGILSKLRGYCPHKSYTIFCDGNKATITEILDQKSGTKTKDNVIPLIPFISEMIYYSLKGFISSLKYTEGKIESFIIKVF